MIKVENWHFANQMSQKGAIPSPLLRELLLRRNYYLFANSLQDSGLDVESVRAKALPQESQEIWLFHADPSLEGEPAIGLGIKAHFSKECPIESSFGLPSPDHTEERALISFSKETGGHALGFITSIRENELKEIQDLLIPIEIVRIEGSVLVKGFVIAETYELKASSTRPHLNFLNALLEKAQRCGQAFLQAFFRRSYLSDGKTSLNEWLRETVVEHCLSEA